MKIVSLFLLISGYCLQAQAMSTEDCAALILERYSHIPTVSAAVGHSVTAEVQKNFWGVNGATVKVDGRSYIAFQQPDWGNGELDIAFHGEAGRAHDFRSGMTWLVQKWSEIIEGARLQNSAVKIDPRAILAEPSKRGECRINGGALGALLSIDSGVAIPPPPPQSNPAPTTEGDRSDVLPVGSPIPGKILPVDGDR